MRKTLFLFVFSFFLSNLTGIETHAQQATGNESAAMARVKSAITALNLTPDTIIPYKTVGDVTLHLSVFKPAAEHDAAPTASVVFFFGGAFKIGSPIQFYPHCAHFASRGITAISVEYRIKSVHGTNPDVCVTDAKSAMRWVRAHAAELNIDPNRIAAAGGSAGGFLAATTATSGCFDQPGEDNTVSCVPDALIIFNANFNRGPGSKGFNAVQRLLGDDWKCFSPLHAIRPGFPPTIHQLGTNDRFVTIEEAQRIKTEIEKVGSRCDLYIYDDQEHGFYNYGWDENNYYETTLTQADDFLKSIGWYN